jgi:hypothetical protein
MKEDQQTKSMDTKRINKEYIHLERMIQIGIQEVEGNVEDMELDELDLEGIEKAYDNLKTGYIPFNQLVLFKEALIKSKGAQGMGVVFDSMKGGKESVGGEE